MLTIAYLANEYPSAVEAYVSEEIEELQRRRVRVIPGTVRRPRSDAPEISILWPSPRTSFQALWLILSRFRKIEPLLVRVLALGSEGWLQRAKALAHTFLGACYAARLMRRSVDHIHVHHGYFGSWIGMTAARLLDVGFSITLHGSDLLLHGNYLDLKLADCRFCFTVSDYNRNYIKQRYPQIDPTKILVSRLGVNLPENVPQQWRKSFAAPFTMLAVGRLHPVKDHAFLVRGCARLRDRGLEFRCLIAGDGPERSRLEAMIRMHELGTYVTLLGHVAGEELDSVYEHADVVVLTSRSEGIPLVLMEGMARGKIVLAPAITGIPELVIHRKTGFLYEAGSMPGFLTQMLLIHSRTESDKSSRESIDSHAFTELQAIREAAVIRVRQHFERKNNLRSFCELFMERVSKPAGNIAHENFVLQQVQPSL